MLDDSNYDSILYKLNTTKEISLWSGAGISFGSGIPYVKHIIECIVHSLSGSEQTAFDFYERYYAKKLPFEALMQIVIQLSNDDQILEIFERGEPSKAHNLIAQLCSTGKVKEIYTTNFDTLIEKALINKGLVLDKDFSVYKDEHSFKKGLKEKLGESEKIRFFKVHGSIEDKKTIRTSIDTIAKQSWMKERSKVVKQAFENNTERLLVVLGYSFSDVFDINPSIEGINKNSEQTVFIVLHDEKIKKPEIFNLKTAGLTKLNFSKYHGQIIRVETDVFLNDISKTLNLENEKPIRKKLAWKNKIIKWSNRLLPSQKEYILSQLYFLIHETDNSLHWNSKATAIAEASNYSKSKIDIILQRVSILHQLGGNENIENAKGLCKSAFKEAVQIRYFSGLSRALQLLAQIAMYNEDNFMYAKRLYLQSLKLKEKINDLQGQAIIWLSLASCLRHEQKHEEAIKACEKSILLRNKMGDVGGLAKCFQGLGNIYLELKEYKNARKKYLKFFELTSKIGDTWSTATANYKLAEVHYCIGKNKELQTALNQCNKCLDVRRFHKNREYANAIYLKGKILYKLGSIDEAKIFHNEAFQLRADLPNKSDLGDSLFDMGVIEIDEANYSFGLNRIGDAIDIYKSKGYLIQLNQINKYLLDIIPQLKNENIIRVNELLSKLENI